MADWANKRRFVVQSCLTQKERQKFRDVAKNESTTVSELIRQLILRHMKEG